MFLVAEKLIIPIRIKWEENWKRYVLQPVIFIIGTLIVLAY